MRLVFHLVGLVALILVFLVGRLMVKEAQRWAEALASRSDSRDTLGRVFVGAGNTIAVIAAIWGFVEAVAVVILAT